MQVFDASSMIHAWDNYPVHQFPGLWDWIARLVEQKDLMLPSVAFEEVDHKAPECGEWLKDNNLKQLSMSSAILQDALRIKGLLGILGDKYGGGVGENDLFIIATARAQMSELVSDERRQPNLPKELYNYKIPAVCLLPKVSVTCINFIEFIKRSNEVFR